MATLTTFNCKNGLLTKTTFKSIWNRRVRIGIFLKYFLKTEIVGIRTSNPLFSYQFSRTSELGRFNHLTFTHYMSLTFEF